ncbi:MAG TPA: ATP-binding protein [Clostridia bacterium]|nr:ATP-binding protein [Clostridia bacterium]
MALSAIEKAKLNAAAVPGDDQVRDRVRLLMGIAGLGYQEVAQEIGYALSSLALFMNGKYDENHPSQGNTLRIRAVLHEFCEKNWVDPLERETGTLYPVGQFQAVRRAFRNAQAQGWAYCVDAAPGIGKTFMLRRLVAESMAEEASKNGAGKRAFFVRVPASPTPWQLMITIANVVGIPTKGFTSQIVRKISFSLRKRRAVLVLDEAQRLTNACLEALRDLLDEPPYIGLVFAGSHEVQQRFNDLRLEQLRSRLQKTIVLSGITEPDARSMISGELGAIPEKAVQALIAGSYVEDYRQLGSDRRPVKYISTRILMNSIRRFQMKKLGSEEAE